MTCQELIFSSSTFICKFWLKEKPPNNVTSIFFNHVGGQNDSFTVSLHNTAWFFKKNIKAKGLQNIHLIKGEIFLKI